MNQADIHNFICSDLPSLDCDPGCVDCCTVALWTRLEWDRLPAAHKENTGLITLPVRGPGKARLEALLPVKKDQIMSLALRKKLAVVEVVQEGLLLTSIGLENVHCPFSQAGTGCTVYEYRPFVCHIMGASALPGRMHCPRDIAPDVALPEDIIMQRFLTWTNLLANAKE